MGVKKVSVELDHIPVEGFEQGSPLSGKVIITTDKQTQIKYANLLVQDKAKVCFRTHTVQWLKHGSISKNKCKGLGPVLDIDWKDFVVRRRKSKRSTYTAHQLFLNYQQILSGEACLQPGDTRYPFHFQIPHDIPSSYSGTHGSIRFKLKVKYAESGLLALPGTYKVEIWIVNAKTPEFLLRKEPRYFEPRAYQEVTSFKVLFISSDPLKLILRLPKSAVVSGQTFTFGLDIINSSSVTINSVHVKFIKRTCWYGKRVYKNVKMEDRVVLEIIHPGIGPQTSRSWDESFTVPSAPNPYLEPCSIIKLCHLIMVEAVPSGLYSRICRMAPIEVCSNQEDKKPIEGVPYNPEMPSTSRGGQPPDPQSQDPSDGSELLPPPYQPPPTYSDIFRDS